MKCFRKTNGRSEATGRKKLFSVATRQLFYQNKTSEVTCRDAAVHLDCVLIVSSMGKSD